MPALNGWSAEGFLSLLFCFVFNKEDSLTRAWEGVEEISQFLETGKTNLKTIRMLGERNHTKCLWDGINHLGPD